VGRALHEGDAGAANRPVVVNEAFMRKLGANPVGARVRTLPRRGETETGPWHEIVGVTADVGMDPTDRGEAEYMYRAVSAAELDPVVVAVRVPATPRRWRPAWPRSYGGRSRPADPRARHPRGGHRRSGRRR
jgi:hypothetical protein